MQRSVATPSGKKDHLYQIDMIRALTMSGVVAVHTTFFTNNANDGKAGGVIMLLHFTRESFFALTAFVLVHVYRRRLGSAAAIGKFWWKRYRLILVPYLAWSALYVLLNSGWSLAGFGGKFADALPYGTAEYHLYFLVVTMQYYLVFPAVVWLLRRTEGHHGLVLGVSFLLELVTTGYLQYGHYPKHGFAAALLSHQEMLLPIYQYYLLLGAVAAWHREQITDWVRRHTAAIWVTAVVTTAAAEGGYAVQDKLTNRGVVWASNVLQPVMVHYCTSAIAVLFWIGVFWMTRRGRRWIDGPVLTMSAQSFGLYLAHPLILFYLLNKGPWHAIHSVLPQPFGTFAVWALTMVGATLLSVIANRTPLSLALTGRSRRPLRGNRPPRPKPPVTPAVHEMALAATSPAPASPTSTAQAGSTAARSTRSAPDASTR